MDRTTLDHLHADPAHWKLGVFYFCREDARLLVPKRIAGLGWTLNFARPLAIPLLVLVLAIAFTPVSAFLGPQPPVLIIMGKLTLIALLVAVASRRPSSSAP